MSYDKTDNQTTERTLVAQVKIYYDLYAPAADAPRPLLIALHGYGANKRQMMREARAIAPEGFAVASVQGFHQHIREPKEAGGPLRYGFGWVTSFRPEESVALHHRALIDLIVTLTHEGVADPARVFLLGFSQAVGINYRFAFTHAERLRGIVGICGGLPGDWETSELYQRADVAVLHLHGAQDEFYPPARVADYAERLRARTRDVEVRGYEAGHELTPAMRADAKEWLASRAPA